MEKINLPENMLEREKYNMLSSQQKGEYITNLLKEILKLNPTGITVSNVKKNTYLSHSVVWHHLEILAARGECLRIERGDTDVYNHNNIINTLKELDFLDNAHNLQFQYNFDLIENIFGKFLRIQRQRESRSDSHFTRAGIIIPYELVDKILDTLQKIKEAHLNGGK